MATKKQEKEKNKMNRVWFDMNTGTRTHKDKKHPSRIERKKELKKMLDNE